MWNIPAVADYSVTYALKSVLKVLGLHIGHLARQLSVYILGSQGRLLLRQVVSEPKASQVPTFYAKVIAAYRKFSAQHLQKEMVDMKNVELGKKLSEASSETSDTKQKKFTWCSLINGDVPGKAIDITWKFG